MTTSTQAESGTEVLFERRGRIGLVTLNRPEARNALNRATLLTLHHWLDVAEADDEVGVVVLTGNGPAFCAGADLKETSQGIESGDFESRFARANESLRLHTRLPRYGKPVIAAVSGYALAGGCGLALSCDIVIAEEGATFGFPEVRRGLVPAMVMVNLSRQLAKQRALDLLLTGRRFGAAEGRDLGLVLKTVPDGTVREAAIEYADAIAAHPAIALRFTKDLFRRVWDLEYDLALEQARDVNQLMRQTRSAGEGAKAFAEQSKEQHS